ncbi:MAG TPA: ADOP family duplicated permease [Bryobacteraceae bacterium]|nr:ADOP family duplicated permease [Bryobacteraceae bacterium]
MIPVLPFMRAFRRQWKLASIAVFSLAIALALGVVGLSVTNTILILPPAAPAPDRLVAINGRTPGKAIDQVSYPDYAYFRDNNHVFTDVAAAPNSVNISADLDFEGRSVRVIMRPVSENYFAVLGIRPFLGRMFSPGDDRSNKHIAVMTYSCWKRLGSDRHIADKVLAGNTIIGVAPKEFTGSFYGLNGDLLTPLSQLDEDRAWFTQRDVRRLFLMARLKPGVSQRTAQAEMSALSGQLASAYPKEDKGRTAVVRRATLLPPDLIPNAELMGTILMTFVLLVLLIACANVANLLLAIAVGRRQEAAIKLALGAPRGRLIREFLKESAVLSVASGVLGFAIAAAVIARFSDWSVDWPGLGAFSFGLNLHLDGNVAAFTGLLALIAGLATGLAPALYASSPNLAQILTGEIVVGGTRKSVRRNALVIVQVAVCTLVLVGMGLCQRNLYNLRHVDLGFSERNLVADTVYMQAEGYDEKRGKEFYGTLRRTVAALPGVESVALAGNLPLLGGDQTPVQIPNEAQTVSAAYAVVDGDYFGTFGIPILAGRTFTSADRQGSPGVVVINHKMAAMFWPGKDPLGRTVITGDPVSRYTVVGVAGDGKYLDIDEAPRPFLYFSLSQNYQGQISVIARTKGDPSVWIKPFAQALRGLGLKIMIQPVTLQRWMDLALLVQRVAAGCVGLLSGLGLLLAIIGLYGAVSYSVSERKKELGIRVALGARPWQLLRMVLRQTLIIAGAGVALGSLLGIGGTILFRDEFYGISAVEWTVLLPVGGAMMAVSLAIAYLSARPWITINPMEAVRHA